MPIRSNNSDTDVLFAQPKAKLAEPSFYKVLLLNDDFTPMDFVIHVLQTVFHKSESEAEAIMLRVHQKGSAMCGTYTHEVAETKVETTMHLARQHEHPLQCVMERDS